jgi:hypothetical protein
LSVGVAQDLERGQRRHRDKYTLLAI